MWPPSPAAGSSIAGTYTLTATSGTLTSAVSASFIVSSGAVKLAFTRSPSTTTAAGSSFGTQPRVAVQNAAGSTVVQPGPGDHAHPHAAQRRGRPHLLRQPGQHLLRRGQVLRVPGGQAGTYTLTATSTGLTSAVSASFTITAAPSQARRSPPAPPAPPAVPPSPPSPS